nr:MAG TPA: hypothetical protein [Caudoviricetes sp.]
MKIYFLLLQQNLLLLFFPYRSLHFLFFFKASVIIYIRRL